MHTVVPPVVWPELRTALDSTAKGWQDERLQVYEPPWFVDAAKIKHLTAPLRLCEAAIRGAGSPQLTACICDFLDPALSQANVGSFQRLWARRGSASLLRRAAEAQAQPQAVPASSDVDGAVASTPSQYVQKLLSLLASGGRVLLCSAAELEASDAEHEEAEAEGSEALPGAGSVTMLQREARVLSWLRAECGTAAAAHVVWGASATGAEDGTADVAAPAAAGRYFILVKRESVGLCSFRPPPCLCCQ